MRKFRYYVCGTTGRLPGADFGQKKPSRQREEPERLKRSEGRCTDLCRQSDKGRDGRVGGDGVYRRGPFLALRFRQWTVTKILPHMSF